MKIKTGNSGQEQSYKPTDKGKIHHQRPHHLHYVKMAELGISRLLAGGVTVHTFLPRTQATRHCDWTTAPERTASQKRMK